MSYAILRVEKAKSLANVGSRAAHNLRISERAAPHADPARRGLNRVLIGGATVAEVTAAVEAKLAGVPKFRKDAVRAVELVLSASPEFFDPRSRSPREMGQWCDASLAWARETFGADNVVSAVLHRDEDTPHVQLLVVPIHDGKLRASHWLDGPAKLSKLQDSYAKALEGLRLRRGERRSKARHVDQREYYRLVQQILKAAAKPAPAAPKLPARNRLGFVSDKDWTELSEALAKWGQEGARLKAEAIAGAHLASSGIGQERAERAEYAERRAAEATKLFKQVMGQVDQAKQALTKLGDQVKQVTAWLKEAGAELERRRDAMGIEKLRAERDELADQIREYTGLRDQYRPR